MSKEKGKYTQNPCVQLDQFGEPHLLIFQNFFIETSLPKFQDKKIKESNVTIVATDNTTEEASDLQIPSHRRKKNSYRYQYENATADSVKHENKKSTFQKLKEKLFGKNKPADQTFDEVKDSIKIQTNEDLEDAHKKAKNLYQLLVASGQHTQAEKLHEYLDVVKYELVLMKNGFNKYLDEKDIIDFMLKSEKGVGVVYLRYFPNILPIDVAKKKMEVDKLLVFDNYVVMYYDPEIDPFRWIKEDQNLKKARDPILFGIIEDSHKLYYIADWIYKDDDLTMDKVEQVLGRKASIIQNATVDGLNYTYNAFSQDMENIETIFTNNIRNDSNVVDTKENH